MKKSHHSFDIDIPTEYESKMEDGNLIIYNDDDGVGVLTISDYKIPTDYNFDLESELVNFAETFDDSFNLSSFELISPYGIATSFVVEERFWKLWVFYKSPFAIFCSFNCAINDKYSEVSSIDKLVSSISIH